MAAGLGLGGAGLAGAGPLAGLLGAGAAPATAAAGSTLAGASGLTDLMGATGAPLASTPSVMPPLDWKAGLKGAAYANKAAGLFGQQPTGGGMTSNPYAGQGAALKPTALPTLGQVGAPTGMPPAPPGIDPMKWLAMLQSQQGAG